MYQISDLYNEYLHKRAREWLVKVNIAGTDYGSSVIVDFTVENDMSGEQEFELGTATLSKLTLRLKTSAVIPPNARVVPYLALQLPESLNGADVAWQDATDTWDAADYPWQGNVTEWLPLGEFYIDKREQIKDVWTFVCYDKLVYGDAAYVSQLAYPTTMQAVWDEICDSLGYEYDSSVVIDPNYMIQAGPAGYTKRQVLAYIASANAACLYVAKDGILKFRRFGADDQPVFDMTKADYISVMQTNPVKEYTRIAIIYNTEESLYYEAGSGDEGHTLYIENPFATPEMTHDLYTRLNGFRYAPVQMDARGYPQLEMGDRIRYGQPAPEEYTWDTADVSWNDADFTWDGFVDGEATIALNHRYTFRGGLKLSLEAPSQSEQESEFNVDGSLSAEINRLNKTALREGRSYFGVTVTRNDGLIVEREDHKSKLILNSDEMDWQIDGESSLYYDALDNKLKFTGDIDMQGGTISWSNVNAPDIDDIPDLDSRLTYIGPNGIYSGTIKTDQLIAGSALIQSALIDTIKANQIDVSSGRITAAQIDGTNLNVVNGNFSGTISATAGLIGGWTISGNTLVSSATYPRIVFDPDNEFIGAYTNANRYIQIDAADLGNVHPYLEFGYDGNTGTIDIDGSNFEMSANVNVELQSTRFVDLTANQGISIYPGYSSGYRIHVPRLSTIYADIDGMSVQDALNNKATSGFSTNSTAVADSHNHGIPNGAYIQLYDSSGNPTYKAVWAVFNGSPAHSHTQN